MTLKKISRVFVLAIIPIMAGLLLASQANADKSVTRPSTPGIILPGDNGRESLSIIPAEDEATIKVQYRRILYGRDKDKDTSGGTGFDSSSEMDKSDKDSALGINPYESAPSPPKTMDRDMGSSTPTDREPRKSGTFRYIIWPFSDSDESTDKDREKSGSDQSYTVDKDKSDQPERTQGDMDKERELQFVLDEQVEGPDRDTAEDAEESDSSDQQTLILAGAGASGSGMGTGGGMGMSDKGTGETMGTNHGMSDTGSVTTPGDHMGSGRGMSPHGTSGGAADTDTHESTGSMKDHGHGDKDLDPDRQSTTRDKDLSSQDDMGIH